MGYLRSKGAYAIYVPGGARGFNGAPDLVICYKGRFIGLEAKIPEGKSRGWQVAHSKMIREAGGISFYPRDLDDVKSVIESIDAEGDHEVY